MGKELKKYFVVVILALAITASLACRGSDPTPSQTPTFESTTTPTATPSLTQTPSPVPSIAPTPNQPPTPVPEVTAVPTATPTSIPTPTQLPLTTTVPTSTVEPEPARLGERINWIRCGRFELECGFVEVPADYKNPEAGSIRIAVNVHRATSPDERIGYLLVNPGGPGESGVRLVHYLPFGLFPDEIVAHFDIVGFDPRGVRRLRARIRLWRAR